MVGYIGVDLLCYRREQGEDCIEFPMQVEKMQMLIQKQDKEWIFFYDARSTLEESRFEKFEDYLKKVEDDITVVVDKKEWLPFAVRKSRLLDSIEEFEEVTSLKEIHICLRKHQKVQLYDTRWPIKMTARPSAKERFNITVLKNWWETLESNYIEKEQEKASKQEQDKQCIRLTDAEYKAYRQKSYDVLELCHADAEQWECFCDHVKKHTSIRYYERLDKKIIFSDLDESKKLKRDERGVEQAIWIRIVKKTLQQLGFFLYSLSTNINGGTSYCYQPLSQFKIGKQSKQLEGTVVLIDMPGIGDAVRLVHLFPEIKDKFNGERITAVVNSKCCKVYELCKEIDQTFICSLRPDLPKFPYIIDFLLTEYFIIHPFRNRISLAWDTKSYLNNKKQNFFHLYADLAGVPGLAKATFQFDDRVENSVLDVFNKFGINRGKPVVGLQFTASMPSKSWSDSVIYDCVTLLKKMLPNAELVNVDFREIPIEGVYNIGQYFDIIQFVTVLKFCDYFVGVDSAGGHIAAMVNTPAITIYGREKPRMGSDHRPLSDKNISLIPEEDCECPEYVIECPKKCKCIDTVSPEEVLYALYKGTSLGYAEKGRELDLQLKIHSIWNVEDCRKSLFVVPNLLSYTEESEYGITFDLNNFTGEIILGELTVEEVPECDILGVDLWIEEDTFAISSYAMFQLEIYKEDGTHITFAHRLLEGWNLMHFRKDGIDIEKARLQFKIITKRKLAGKVCINQVYTL